MLYDPPSHEPLTERPWDEDRVRAAIAAIVAETESAFDETELWPAHPRDLEDGPLPAVSSLYLGASGVIWALHELERAGLADLGRDWAPVAVRLVEHYQAQPDFPDFIEGTAPLAADGRVGDPARCAHARPRALAGGALLEAVRANESNPFWELMWGSPGTMIAARVMASRTGDPQWLGGVGGVGRRCLLAEWRDDLWKQDLYGRPCHCLGPAHGFAGNVLALAGGGLLDPARRAELEQRADRHAREVRPARGRALPVAAGARASRRGTRTQDAVVPRRAGNGRLARDDGAGRRAADGAAARGRRAHLARRPASARAPSSATAPPATGTRS